VRRGTSASQNFAALLDKQVCLSRLLRRAVFVCFRVSCLSYENRSCTRVFNASSHMQPLHGFVGIARFSTSALSNRTLALQGLKKHERDLIKVLKSRSSQATPRPAPPRLVSPRSAPRAPVPENPWSEMEWRPRGMSGRAPGGADRAAAARPGPGPRRQLLGAAQGRVPPPAKITGTRCSRMPPLCAPATALRRRRACTPRHISSTRPASVLTRLVSVAGRGAGVRRDVQRRQERRQGEPAPSHAPRPALRLASTVLRRGEEGERGRGKGGGSIPF